jgi:hypothetical protein
MNEKQPREEAVKRYENGESPKAIYSRILCLEIGS